MVHQPTRQLLWRHSGAFEMCLLGCAPPSALPPDLPSTMTLCEPLYGCDGSKMDFERAVHSTVRSQVWEQLPHTCVCLESSLLRILHAWMDGRLSMCACMDGWTHAGRLSMHVCMHACVGGPVRGA
eukprot:358642-Chlamydomonas_euryale.AAC.5